MHILRVVLVIIAFVASVALGWEIFDAATRPEIASAPSASRARVAALAPADDLRPVARQAVEERLQLAQETSGFFNTMRRAFPQDFDRLVNTFAQRAVDGSKLDSPDIYLAEAVRAVRRTHGVLAAKADSLHLEKLFETQTRMLDALAKADPQMCVDFLYGKATERFYEFSARNRPLVVEMAQASLDAILDGRTSRVERRPPTDADFTQLETALLEKGLGRPEIEALLDGKAPEPPLPDAMLCRAGSVYLETLRDMPEDTRMRIYGLAVEVLART
ncbi:MAG: hypothetical protein Q8M31_06290 [Beijerinckiaceae bacterium]|nr:hypothetical protein [Beijerinckiaceae bacterium]